MATSRQTQKVGTYACQHYQVGNVLSATCGVCGPLVRQQPTPHEDWRK